MLLAVDCMGEVAAEAGKAKVKINASRLPTN